MLHSRLLSSRLTPDNAQLGILFRNGTLANIFASFYMYDGDCYRNGLTLNFQNCTIYRNASPPRNADANELSLVLNGQSGRTVAAQCVVSGSSSDYQWDTFARAVRGCALENAVIAGELVGGLQIIEAMARADAGHGVDFVEELHAQ